MNTKVIILLALFTFSFSAPQDIDYSLTSSDFSGCSQSKSPIDISYYVPEHLDFPAYPKFVLNNTFYTPINNLKFEYLNSDDSKLPKDNTANPYSYLGMNVTGFGSAFFLYLNKTVTYDLKELRLHVYSEHTFEGHKMDLELQLVHQLNQDRTEESIRDSSEVNQLLTMSVLFSIARDKKSKFIEDILEEDEDKTDERFRYSFALVKSLDLNQFFNFHEPYYLYEGSGTTPFDCSKNMRWLINKKVEYLSEKQMRRIQIAMMEFKVDTNDNQIKYQHYPNGNSKIVVSPVSFDSSPRITYVENTDRDGDDV